MRLVISKNTLLGRTYSSITLGFLFYIISAYFFGLLIEFEGSDYSQNIYNITAATEGYFGGRSDNILMYLVFDAHFYFWLGKLGSVITDHTLLLRSLTACVVLVLTGLSVFSTVHRKNRIVLLVLLIAIFLHPRFLDLVVGNIRSAVALSIAFWALSIENTQIKYALLLIAPTFHLGVVVVLFLYIAYRFWGFMPALLCRPDIKVLSVFLLAGILCLAAKLLFPERGGGAWEGRALYTAAIFIIFCNVFFLGKHFVNNVYGFVALGLISLVIWGAVLNFSTMRYFSFFFPFLGSAVVYFDRQHQVLILLMFVMSLFTLVSHSTWLLGS